jgi:hypothetical protein
MMRLVGALLAVAVVIGVLAVPAEAKKKPISPTVGSTITTSRVKVTLHAYRQPVTGDRSVETMPVGQEAAINVEACNRTTSTQTVGTYQFFLETPDGHFVVPAKTIARPRPQLRSTPVDARACARGWLSYQLPTGTRAAFVVFQAGAMFTATLHRWTVPKP